MKFWFIILFIIMTVNSYAGIVFNLSDSAMVSEDKRLALMQIPYFQKRGDAIRFANQHLGDETMRRALRNRAQWFLSLSWLASDPTPWQIDMAKHYAYQQDYCLLAYNIITGVKNAQNKKDKAQITVPTFVSNDQAKAWVDMMKRESSLLEALNLKYRKVLAEYLQAENRKDKINISILHAQVERIHNAMQHYQDNHVGATVYSYSIPMPRTIK